MAGFKDKAKNMANKFQKKNNNQTNNNGRPPEEKIKDKVTDITNKSSKDKK